MPDYFTPRFTLRQAAAASDFPYNTMRSYYQRAWFRSHANALRQGRGRASLLCLADVLVLTIASRLIEVGVSPINAYAAAQPFAVAARTPKGMQRRRPPELFNRKTFETLFVWQPGSLAQVVPVQRASPDLPLTWLFDNVGDDGYASAAVAIPLNPLERLVFQRLGIEAELEDLE